MIQHYKGYTPQIHPSAYIAENATITGDVIIEEFASIWFQTVIRGDVDSTHIGKRVNIQDLSMVHQSPDYPVVIGDDVTIGHQVTIHGATIHENALIGMGSIVLDGAAVGKHAFIGAGSLIPPGKEIPPNTLAFGRPAKVIRELTEADYKEMQRVQKGYIDKGQYYKNQAYRATTVKNWK